MDDHRRARALLATLALSILAACGQKGPLYLPDAPAPATTPTTAPAPSAATTPAADAAPR